MASEMAAGREMDAEIAVRLFGYRTDTVGPDARGEHGGTEVIVPPGYDGRSSEWTDVYPRVGAISREFWTPRYSTDLQSAWAFVEQLTSVRKWRVALHSREGGGWIARICCLPNVGGWVQRSGATMPEAICKAALAAVEAPHE